MPSVWSYPEVRRALLGAGVLRNDSRKLSPPVDVEGEPVPAPVQPQTEGRAAYNPYRGGEMHGVIAPTTPLEDDAEGYGDGTVDVHYAGEADEHVLPVRIVSADEGETINAWRASQSVAPVAGDRPPVQVLPRNRKRTKAKLQNLAAGGTDGVWVGPNSSVGAMNGYYLKPGDSIDLATTEEVYAVSASANAVPIGVLVEYTQGA